MESSKRILVIDDEGTCRFPLIEWLSSYGYECHEASDGTEGLNRAIEEEWDLILSDILMPGLNGIELVRMLKPYKSNVPVIMISGERTSSSVQAAFREGAYDFIFKPFEMSELEMTIARAMEKSRLVRENEEYRLTLESRVAQQAEKIMSLSVGAILSLAFALEAKDCYTNGHSQRVAEYGVLIAQQIGLDYKTEESVRTAGQLHDIGKIGMRESILNKGSRLTDEEFTMVQQHPVIGSRILSPVITDECIICGVKHHHERFDGTGYPDKLAGEQIPLEARIIAVADSYDAMTTNRAYRAGMSYEKALVDLECCSGRQFDPMVVDAFIRIPVEKVTQVLQSIPSVNQWIVRTATSGL